MTSLVTKEGNTVSSHKRREMNAKVWMLQKLDNQQIKTIESSKRLKENSQEIAAMTNTRTTSQSSKLLKDRLKQGSSQMPLSLSSTKATRKNEALLSIDENLSNNNGNSEKETNKNVSIKENRDNDNFSIDIEEILNYEPASNNHSLNDTL